jgi:hypothetical protein
MSAALDASPPFGSGFRHETRAPLPHFEDVVVAPARVERINHFVVRRLRVHFDSDSVALAADAFDLNHVFPLLCRGDTSARLLDGGPITASEKPRTCRTRTLDRFGDAFRQAHRSAHMGLEHEAKRASLAVERRQELSAAVW